MKNIGNVVGWMLGIILGSGIIVVGIILSYWLGYLGGMILNWGAGENFVKGLNLIFGTDRFTREMIPTICATLSVLGGYFRAHLNTNNKKKD